MSENINMLYSLGYKFEFGVGLPKNLEKAMKYYTLAARIGHIKSTYRLGLLYKNGYAGEQNKWMAEACLLSVMKLINNTNKGSTESHISWPSKIKQYCIAIMKLGNFSATEKNIEF